MTSFTVSFASRRASSSSETSALRFRQDLDREEQTEAVLLARASQPPECRTMTPADQVFQRDPHTRHVALKILVQEAARHEDIVLRNAARKNRSPLQCRLASFGFRRPSARGPSFFSQVIRDVDTLMTDATRDNYTHTLKELSAIRMWRVQC